MQFFYVEDISENLLVLSEEESHHCIKVLRRQTGDMIKLTDGKGNLFEARIEKANPKKCEVKIINSHKDYGKRDFKIHIAVAPTKNMSRIEWFLEKATEIGIDEVSFVICDYSERKEIKRERLVNISKAAAKQSLKAWFPKINTSITFAEFISQETSAQKYIAYLDPENSKSIKSLYRKGNDTTILVGPEGDFSKEEVNKAIEAGFIPINLSESRLRTETAALVSCFMIHFFNTP
ncbi:16S rRNA (uracil(1498)-N(3))-methyltransferase [candidate division KSB1 bacterium]